MSDNNKRNLDYLAAKHAQEIVNKLVDDKKTDAGSVDNTVTKTLGVLQENGVYACFLYLLAKEKENGITVVEEMLDLLDGLGFGWNKPGVNSPKKILSHINDKVTANLERLLLAKETLEQMLIYARYGAKARKAAS